MFIKALFSFLLKNAHHDALIMHLPGQKKLTFGVAASAEAAVIEIHKPLAMLKKLKQSGTIGLAESYMAGDWQTPNLSRFLLWAARNQTALSFRFGQKTKQKHWQKSHAAAENSLTQSPKNITYHYDLGNDFYKLWLDASMTYSAACFYEPGQSLESAQAHKYQRILTALAAQPGQNILEIGCGWGGFLEIAVQRDLKVTGITLSPAQAAFAKARLAKVTDAAAAEKSVKIQDYRHTIGQFDHIVSIEMFEAVGQKYWQEYADKLAACLKPGGRAALQVITIAEKHFDDYCQTPDFIQKYIFPGGMLPTLPHLLAIMRRAGLAFLQQQAFAQDYADTLHCWRQRFQETWHEIQKLGYDTRFRRMWEFYLSYCEAGFRNGDLDVVQVVFEKPLTPAPLPQTHELLC